MNDHRPREATNAGTEPGLQLSSNGKHFRGKVVQMPSLVRRVAPWLMAGMFSLLFLLRRRG